MGWHAKQLGGYIRTSDEAIENATLLAHACYNIGWTKKAVCAMLGNGAGESGLNPWRWQSDYIPTVNEFQNWTYAQSINHGYGIFQFTPANKYINPTNETALSGHGYAPNFSDNPGNATDGAAQTRFFCQEVSSDWRPQNLYGYYYDDFININVDITSWYFTNYTPFINGKDNNDNDLTLDELVGVFELCYERPTDVNAASSYYTRCNNAAYWMGVIPDPGSTIPVWLLFQFDKWRRK